MDPLHQSVSLPVTQLSVSTAWGSWIHVDEIVDRAVRQVD